MPIIFPSASLLSQRKRSKKKPPPSPFLQKAALPLPLSLKAKKVKRNAKKKSGQAGDRNLDLPHIDQSLTQKKEG
jgi:hypothetical protein